MEIKVITGDLGDVWAATLNGRLIGGWHDHKIFADCIADDLHAALDHVSPQKTRITKTSDHKKGISSTTVEDDFYSDDN